MPQRRSGRWDDLNRQLKATYEAYGAGEIPPRLIELMARFDRAHNERRPGTASRPEVVVLATPAEDGTKH